MTHLTIHYGKCALCRNDAELQKSHAIPDAIFRRLFIEGSGSASAIVLDNADDGLTVAKLYKRRMLQFFKSIFGASGATQTVPTQDQTETTPETAHQYEVAPIPVVSDISFPDPVETAAAPASAAIGAEADRSKTQAELDAELVESSEFKEAVEDGMRAWEQKLEALIAKVRTAQSEGQLVPLMLLTQYFWLQTPHSEIRTELLIQELRARIEKDLSIKDYQTYIEDKIKTRWNSYPRTLGYYVGEFRQLRSCYLDGLTDLFERIPERVGIVEEHYAELKLAEVEFRPTAGENQMMRFRGFMTKYAQQHLPGVTPLDFFPERVPRYISDHYASDIQTAGFLLLWGMVGVVAVARAEHTQSTSEVGIQFERQLITEITEHLPDANIEPTPVTGDQGADVIVLAGGVKIVIQAKRYTGVVGNAAVQEVFAAQQFYDADYAMVVTTSRYTPAAQALAAKVGVELATSSDYLRRIQQMLV